MSGKGQGLTWHAAHLVRQKEKRDQYNYVSEYNLDAFLDTFF